MINVFLVSHLFTNKQFLLWFIPVTRILLKINLYRILTSISLSVVLTATLKAIFRHELPDTFFKTHTWAFPSGHAGFATSICFSFAYEIYFRYKNKYIRTLSNIFFLTITLLEGLRVVLEGYHYPKDVVAAIVIIGFYTIFIYRVLFKQSQKKQVIFIISNILIALCVAYFPERKAPHLYQFSIILGFCCLYQLICIYKEFLSLFVVKKLVSWLKF